MKTILAAGFASFLLTASAWCSEEVYNDLLFKAKAYADRCSTRIIRPYFEEVRDTCEKAMDRKFADKQITEEQLIRLKTEFLKYLAVIYYGDITKLESKPDPAVVLNEIYNSALKRTQEIPRPPILELLKAGEDAASVAALNGKITHAQSSDFAWNYERWLKNIYASPQIVQDAQNATPTLSYDEWQRRYDAMCGVGRDSYLKNKLTLEEYKRHKNYCYQMMLKKHGPPLPAPESAIANPNTISDEELQLEKMQNEIRQLQNQINSNR